MKITKMWLNINGADRMVLCDPEKDTLAVLIRRIGLTGTKVGCGTGVCGACSVILNGKVVRACVRKMKTVEEYSTILTIEGIGTPRNLHPLQQAWIYHGAVQCGFCTPGFIVSAYTLLQENPDPTREMVRDWFRRNRNICRCTGYKPLVDAVMSAAKVMRGEGTMADITYKEPADKAYYGTAVPRPSALPKVTGLCDYGDDLAEKMPSGTLHLAIVQPKIAHHANILSVDTSEAEKMPGVVRVLTAKDVQGSNNLGGYSSHLRNEVEFTTQEILASKKISRYGDVVALVVADTQENAREAAKKVKVGIEQLPEYLNYLDAVVPGAVSVQNGPNQFIKQPLFKGDYKNIETLIEDSNYSVSGSFHSTREPHLSIEGDVVQAYWGIDDMLTIQCKAQGITMARFMMAGGIGLPPDKIRIITNPTGGSFGWSMAPGSYALAAVAAMATGMPVSLSLSYEEHMHFSGKRSPSYSNASIACDKDGKITALQYDIGVEIGPYTSFAEPIMQRLVIYFGWPYSIPNIAGLGRAALSNHNYCATYRGFGSPQVFTASEAIIDMLAEKAGIDPFDFRYINIGRKGDIAPTGYPYREISVERLMDEMRPLYKAATARAKAGDTPEKRRGVGLAFGGYNCSSGNMDNAGCKLELNPDGSVSVYNTWEDIGQGGDIGTVMVVLEALKPLGLTPEQVKVRTNDSKTCPDSGPAAGSRSHMMNGLATIETAKIMLKAMLKEDGSFRTYDEMKIEGLSTVFEATYSNTAIEGLCELNADTGVGDPLPTYMYAFYMAEVEVDTATGKPTVLGITCVCDVGNVGNIDAVLGQGYGGISHAIGFALTEDYDDVKKHTNIAAAGIPTIDMIPDHIDIRFIDHPRAYTPFGSSGCSEMFQSGDHVAVINAIYNACGVRIYELPASPQKVKEGLDTLAAGKTIEPPAPYFLGSDFFDTIEDIEANPVEGKRKGYSGPAETTIM
ncbi:MAG: molybdopterin-dependent oxidoreductase [Clostridiales bacterium]|nr:molybdopterin-dependent oxidoreductase [Clostridiales bacterium]